jgi:S-adenosylmethionine synthetase
MPAPIYYAHRILKLLAEARRSGVAKALGPDAKSQVTIRYEHGEPIEATQIVVSTQHLDEKLSSEDIRVLIEPSVRKALPPGWITNSTVWHVNPTGKFVTGSPDGDCGLTGRKIIVDTYGAPRRTAGARFPETIPPRSIGRPLMRRGTSPRMWSRRDLPRVARSSCPMQ